VYVVEELGETETEPEAPNVPTPEIVTEVAPGTLHESVELPPSAMVPGDEEKEEPAAVGHAATVTVVCSVIGEQPPAPSAVSV
jgi:hypothetical protein